MMTEKRGSARFECGCAYNGSQATIHLCEVHEKKLLRLLKRTSRWFSPWGRWKYS